MNVPEVVHLLPRLDENLITLLQSLSAEEWQAQTVAKLWKVKDVAAHLLDGNIRILSMLRDGYFGEHSNAHTGEELIIFLNQLNADWVKAMKRVSPQMLILLHQATGPPYCRYYASLDPAAPSPFAVNWLGETESNNRTHIAREYTEKWLHQQQIREAANKPGIMTKEFFHPFISTCMLALPYTYRNTPAAEDTVLEITVAGNIGDTWFLLRKHDKWHLFLLSNGRKQPHARLIIPPDIAWKLFSKSIRGEQVKDSIVMEGQTELVLPALDMVSFMA